VGGGGWRWVVVGGRWGGVGGGGSCHGIKDK